MATRFISNDDLWREIQTRVASGKRIRAAVAYFGGRGATLLKLKRGDSIVVDMSIAAVRQGVTNPREIRKLFRRGVNIFSRGSLHAKFLIIDKTLITSSANVSNNSKNILDEAGILTTASGQYIGTSRKLRCSLPLRTRHEDDLGLDVRPQAFPSQDRFPALSRQAT